MTVEDRADTPVSAGFTGLGGNISETDATVLSSPGRISENRGCIALVPGGGMWRGPQ